MSRVAHLSIVLSLAVLLASIDGLAFGAAAGKGGVNQRGGKAAEQMSTKGAANTNAQWSADPDHGWVRADERHKLNQKADSSNGVKNNDPQKAKGKAKKS